MRALYTGAVDSFMDKTKPDVARWTSIYSVISQNSPLVDRCEIIQMPYNYKLYDVFKMPRDLVGFNKTYEDCCMLRAQELITLSNKLNKKITVFYSGGIDSTLIVVSFLKLLTPTEFKSKIDIALTARSIQENSNFYYDHIRPMGNIVSSQRLQSMFDSSTIIVGGEHNDQLFGSDVVGRVAHGMPDFTEFHKPYSRNHVVNFFVREGLNQDDANFWFDLLDNHIKQAPCEVKTNYHFWWWLNFSFKWQNVFFRILFRAKTALQSNINQEFVTNYFHHFFSSDYFQKWSMLNHDLKIKNDWKSYKWEAKRIIYEFNKDEFYRDNKLKLGSLIHLFGQRKVEQGLTSNYEFLENLDPSEFYIPNNSFG